MRRAAPAVFRIAVLALVACCATAPRPAAAYTRILLDAFTDGTAAGDPDWTEPLGNWTTTAGKQFAADPLRTNIAVSARAGSLSRGRIQAKIRLLTPPAPANAALLFHYVDATRYRYVAITPTGLAIGQVGTINGEGPKLLAKLQRAFPAGSSTTLTVDLLPGNRVQVAVNAEAAPALAGTFVKAATGRLGLRLVKSRSTFDDFAVYRPASSVPAPPGDVVASDGSYPDRVRVAWSASATALSYRVFRVVTGDPAAAKLLGSTTALAYRDLTAAQGVSYSYWVKAVNEVGASGLSAADTGYALPAVAPIVRAVDPPVVCFGLPVEARVYVEGLSTLNDATEVRLVSADGQAEHVLPFAAPQDPEVLAVTLPDGLAAGAWSVRVTARNGLSGSLASGLTSSSTITVSLNGVQPAAIPSSDSPFPVRVSGGPLPGLPGGFFGNARLYLRASMAGGAVAALAHAAVASPTELTASVPGGLAPGLFDLVVANPDATCGVLAEGVKVLASPLPTISEVVPTSWVAGTAAQRVTVGGDFFDTVTLDATCQPPGGGSVFAAGTNVVWTQNSVEGTLDLGDVPAGSSCVVRVVNLDDGEASAGGIGVATPAGALNAWSPAVQMAQSRRGPGLAVGAISPGGHFLYAIGGDASDVLSSVESTPLDDFGVPEGWAVQRNQLPAGRVFAGAAVIGDFLYLVGGSDDASATADVYRAQVLRPAGAPQIGEAGLRLAPGEGGLPSGVWYYRVAALFPAENGLNPSGESLAGDAAPVQVPPGGGFEVELAWSVVPEASGYAIYRTPTPDLAYTQMQLLTTVVGGGTTSFTDTGTVIPGEGTPLLPGALGRWHAVAPMGSARAGHAVVAAPDPDTPGAWFLYAAGGWDGAGSPLDSIEYCTVTTAGSVSAWTAVAGTLSAARADLGGWLVTDRDSEGVAPGRSWIYFGPGKSSPSTFSRAVEAFLVVADGAVSTTTTTAATTSDLAGYAAFDGAGDLFAIGGAAGAASSGGKQASLCLTGGSCTGPPDLTPWNSVAATLGTARVHPGYAQDGALFYVAGGHDGSTATNSVEWSSR